MSFHGILVGSYRKESKLTVHFDRETNYFRVEKCGENHRLKRFDNRIRQPERWPGTKVADGRREEVRLLLVDYFCMSERTIFGEIDGLQMSIAIPVAMKLRRPRPWNSLKRKRDEYWKTERTKRGTVFKAWLRASITRVDPRRSYFGIRRAVFAVEKLSPSPVLRERSRAWINRARVNDINLAFVYSRARAPRASESDTCLIFIKGGWIG